MGYYLTHGIYPKWFTFVKTIVKPATKIEDHFAKMQEASQKDIERAFSVLQARFTIVREPAKFWYKKILHNIITVCVIMLNNIIEDKRDMDIPFEFDNVDSRVKPTRNPNRINSLRHTRKLRTTRSICSCEIIL
jgi:hypothetical protein